MPEKHWLDRLVDGASVWDAIKERLNRWAEQLRDYFTEEEP